MNINDIQNIHSKAIFGTISTKIKSNRSIETNWNERTKNRREKTVEIILLDENLKKYLKYKLKKSKNIFKKSFFFVTKYFKYLL